MEKKTKNQKETKSNKLYLFDVLGAIGPFVWDVLLLLLLSRLKRVLLVGVGKERKTSARMEVKSGKSGKGKRTNPKMAVDGALTSVVFCDDIRLSISVSVDLAFISFPLGLWRRMMIDCIDSLPCWTALR